MYKLMNDYETIMECSSKIFLEKLSKEIERHYTAYKKQHDIKSENIKTQFDEEFKYNKSHITYLTNKIRCVEYEISNNIGDKKETARHLQELKQELKTNNILRTNLEEKIEISKTEYRVSLTKDIPDHVMELFNDNECGFRYTLNLEIVEID